MNKNIVVKEIGGTWLKFIWIVGNCEIENCTFFVQNFFLIIVPYFFSFFLRWQKNFVISYTIWNKRIEKPLCNYFSVIFSPWLAIWRIFFTFFWKLSKVCNIENWNWKFFETSKSFSFTQMSAYLLTVKRILFCKSAPSTSKIFSEIENYLEMKLSWSLQDWKKVFHFLSWWSLYFYISKRTQL